MHKVYLGIGGNLGDRHGNLVNCRDLVSEKIGLILETSSIYRTEAWGMKNAPDFYNQVIEVATKLNPKEVLRACHSIEELFGRERVEGEYLSRQMDVDVLLYDDLVKNEEEMKIPHPRMTERNFVLVPLADIAPLKIHPVYRKSIADLLKESPDKGSVEKVDEV